MKLAMFCGVLIFTTGSGSLLARQPTCMPVLDNCRNVMSEKHWQCEDICSRAVVLCEQEKKDPEKREAEDLLRTCRRDHPPKK